MLKLSKVVQARWLLFIADKPITARFFSTIQQLLGRLQLLIQCSVLEIGGANAWRNSQALVALIAKIEGVKINGYCCRDTAKLIKSKPVRFFSFKHGFPELPALFPGGKVCNMRLSES